MPNEFSFKILFSKLGEIGIPKNDSRNLLTHIPGFFWNVILGVNNSIVNMIYLIILGIFLIVGLRKYKHKKIF